MVKYQGFWKENHSVTGFEPWLAKHVFEPIVRRIPESVHPNTLSILNHILAWTVFAAAAMAPYLSDSYALSARIYAAVAFTACLLLDSLDGMHARRTGQTSKLGEVMDHWLDAINVPLGAAGFILTLGVNPWLVVFSMALSTPLYNAQLILYHHTGDFVHGPASGVDAQVGLIAAYVVFGILFFLFPREARWLDLAVNGFIAFGILANIAVFRFFYRRTAGYRVPLLAFTLVCVLFSALFLAGTMNPIVYTVGIVMISFRLTGTYVLHTVLRKPYGGMDWSIPLWLVVLAIGHLVLEPYQWRGYQVRAALPYLFCLYIVALNLFDLVRHLPALRSAEEENGETTSEA